MTPQEAQDLLERLQQAGSSAPLDHPIFAEVDKQIIPMLETIAGMRIEHCLLVHLGDEGGVQTLYYASAEEREVALKTYTAKGGLAARMDRLVGPTEVQPF